MVVGCLDEHLNKNEVASVSLGFSANLATSSSLGPAIGMEIKMKKKMRYDVYDQEATSLEMLGETRNAFVCNDAVNVSCNSRMCNLLDDNNFFIFDDESVRISPVSKMPFRKKPSDSMIVRSKNNMIKSLPRTIHKWLPKLQPLAEPVAKWFPRVKHCPDLSLDLRFGMFKTYDGDVIIGYMTIKKVYYVEGLGHNLFSVGQFCDKGLEVAFRNSMETDTQETDKNQAKNDKTKHKVEKIEKDEVNRSRKTKSKPVVNKSQL
nr:integrase, catalytic region, zinc finger, CCHC-type, peptidase aspartic, catalytic [Tanacetum cinerariifolium]